MEFKELGLIEPLLDALKQEGYKTPTPIQEKTISPLLEGKDVIGIAQTGTGKTAAFVLPILQKLHERSTKTTTPRALVLAPTRELAAQISESFKAYGAFLNLKTLEVYGGVGIIPQIEKLKRGIDILVATPGRLKDLMGQGKVDLGKVEFLVLDEADRMLDMGFLKDVKKIASALSVERQSLFFSATMSNAIADLTRDFLKTPVRVEITPQSTPVDKIEQCVFFIDQGNKNELLLDLIVQEKMSSVLVFVKAKHRANRVAKMLGQGGIAADSIHGDKSQHQRIRALKSFKAGKIKVLVATDIAARGIDVENISHVINYDLPNEAENYVHRIGRTARAGAEGTAYSFCAAEDRNFLNQIERITKRRTPQAEHKYHSVKAKSAEGADAKPKPRVQGMRSRQRTPGRKPRNSKKVIRGSGGGSSKGRKGGRSVFHEKKAHRKGSSRVRRGRTQSRR
jgi:ATP-dependent RNA helicase RhlE